MRVDLIARDGVNHYEAVFNATPYVQNGTITIYPGETLVFQFAVGPDGPGAPVFVREIVGPDTVKVPPSVADAKNDPTLDVQHDPKTDENVYFVKPGSIYAPSATAKDNLKDEPPGTLILSYRQVEGRPDMELRIEHNLPTSLKYDAQMDRLGQRGSTGLQSTSTCPVQSLITGLETWPYPIGVITLTNFRSIDMSNGFSCN